MSWWKTKTKTNEPTSAMWEHLADQFAGATRECAALLVERADLKLRLDEARLAASEARDRVERMLEMNQRRTRRIETLTDGLRKAQLACKRLRGERDAARAELAKRPTTERAEQLLAEAGQQIVRLQRDLAGAAETNAKLEKLALERKQERDRSFLLRREQRVLLEGQVSKARLACKRMREELRHAQEKLARIQREGAGPAAPSNREPSGSPSLVPSLLVDEGFVNAMAKLEADASSAASPMCFIPWDDADIIQRTGARAGVRAVLKHVAELLSSGTMVTVNREEWNELCETRDVYERMHAADMRGVQLWRDAAPGRELKLPDRGRLVAWLIEQLDAAKRELAMVRTNWDGAIESLGQAAIERDAARAEAERLRSERALIAKALDAEFSGEPLWSVAERLRGERDEAKEMHAKSDGLREEHWQEVLRLRTAPPTVAVTDVEKAAEHIHTALRISRADVERGIVLAILRKHTRAASVEEVVNAMHVARWGKPFEENGSLSNAHLKQMARAALRALGVREAEKNATPFVVDREKVARNLSTLCGLDAKAASYAAGIAADTIEGQRAEHEKGGAA